MNARTQQSLLKLIALIEEEIRLHEADKRLGFKDNSGIEILTEHLEFAVDSACASKCDSCKQYFPSEDLDDQGDCEKCSSGWEGILPDGSADVFYKAPERDDF